MPPCPVRGAYKLTECVQWALAEAKEATGHGTSEKARIDLARAQTLRTLVETERSRGELLPATEVLERMTELATAMVSALEGFAPRMAPRLAELEDPGAIEDAIRAEVFDVRSRLATIVGAMASDLPDNTKDADPGPQPDLFGMGGVEANSAA